MLDQEDEDERPEKKLRLESSLENSSQMVAEASPQDSFTAENTGIQCTDAQEECNSGEETCDNYDFWILGFDDFTDDIDVEMLFKMEIEQILAVSLTNRRFNHLVRKALIKTFTYRDPISNTAKFNFSKFYAPMESIDDTFSAEFTFLLGIFEEYWPSSPVDIHRVALEGYRKEGLVSLHSRLYDNTLPRMREHRHIQGHPGNHCSEVLLECIRIWNRAETDYVLLHLILARLEVFDMVRIYRLLCAFPK